MSGITQNAKVFVNSIIDLMKTNDVAQDKIDQMQPKIVELVEDFTQTRLTGRSADRRN